MLKVIFDQSFKIVQKMPKARFYWKTTKINNFAPPKLTFSNQNSVRFSSFFQHLFPDLIFPTFEAHWCQNARFWHPLGTRRYPKWRPKSPKWRQKLLPKTPWGIITCGIALKVAFGSVLATNVIGFGWILHGFLMDFGWIWMKSGIFFFGLWLLFCSSICRVPRPRWHETNKRKTSRTCRYMQKHAKKTTQTKTCK